MTTRSGRGWLIAAIAACGFAWALPPLETYRGHGLELQVPRGWTVTVDEAAGTVLVAEDPNDPAGAAMLLVVVPAQPGLDAAYLTEAVLSQVAPARAELGREEAGGVVWTLQSFDADGIPALLTSLAIGQDGAQVATIALLSAHRDAFAELGGAALLFVTFGAADPALFASPAGAAGPAAGAAAPGAPAAFPPLEPIAELGGAYLKPAGWHFGAESAPGQDLIYLQEDPADAHGAAILFLTQTGVGAPAAGADLVGAVVTAFAQTLGLEATTELRRSGDGTNGARLLSGTRLGRASKGFFAVFADGGDVRVYAIAAPAERFDAIGGHGLMWITLGGMSVADFERSDEMQAWYRPAPSWGDVSWDGSFGAQQMFLDMQSQMFMAWSNNMGGNSCWGDSYGCY